MDKRISRIRHERGNVTIIALMILVVLTLIGISVSRTATTDIQIAANQIPFKQNFYIAEGGQNREAADIGGGNYPVTNVEDTDKVLATEEGMTGGGSLPGNAHEVLGEPYDFSVKYSGYYPAPAGYSIIYFSRYDYQVETNGNIQELGNGVDIDSRYYIIGPKAE